MAGLDVIARDLAKGCKEATEADRYMAGVRDLLASGKAFLDSLHSQGSIQFSGTKIGWRDHLTGDVYLIPVVTRFEVDKILPDKILISAKTLNNQLDNGGYIKSKGSDEVGKTLSVAGHNWKVLHINGACLFGK